MGLFWVEGHVGPSHSQAVVARLHFGQVRTRWTCCTHHLNIERLRILRSSRSPLGGEDTLGAVGLPLGTIMPPFVSWSGQDEQDYAIVYIPQPELPLLRPSLSACTPRFLSVISLPGMQIGGLASTCSARRLSKYQLNSPRVPSGCKLHQSLAQMFLRV